MNGSAGAQSDVKKRGARQPSLDSIPSPFTRPAMSKQPKLDEEELSRDGPAGRRVGAIGTPSAEFAEGLHIQTPTPRVNDVGAVIDESDDEMDEAYIADALEEVVGKGGLITDTNAAAAAASRSQAAETAFFSGAAAGSEGKIMSDDDILGRSDAAKAPTSDIDALLSGEPSEHAPPPAAPAQPVAAAEKPSESGGTTTTAPFSKAVVSPSRAPVAETPTTGVMYRVDGKTKVIPFRAPHPTFASWEVDHNRFELKQILGKGSYGAVAEAIDHVRGTRVAIKQIRDVFGVFENAKRIYREISVLRNLDHENVIKLVHLEMPKNLATFTDLYIVFECMDLDLNKLGRDVKQSIGLDHVRWFMYQLMKSIKYIHSAGIIHRDIKPANVLLSEACDLKLCDFGLARGRESADSDVVEGGAAGAAQGDLPPPKALKRALTKHVVTRWYRAPELPLYNDGKYEFSIDIWAAGCVMAEMLGMTSSGLERRNRLPLFPGTSCLPLSRGTSIDASAATRKQIKKDQLNVIFDVIGTPKGDQIDRVRTSEAREYLRSLEPREPVDLKEKYRAADDVCIDLLRRMLLFFPEDRITAEETLAHPFFAPIRRPETEISHVSPMRFSSVTRTTIRAAIVDEIKFYNKHLPIVLGSKPAPAPAPAPEEEKTASRSLAGKRQVSFSDHPATIPDKSEAPAPAPAPEEEGNKSGCRPQ